MKTKIITAITIMVFLAGLVVLNYPVISTLYNQLHEGTVIAGYDAALEQMQREEISQLETQAREYNQQIAEEGPTLQDAFEAGETIEDALYDQILNLENNGIMGSIEIPKIHVFLPIYHGTAAEVLEIGIGHLQGSSIPVGGETTHAVLTGHRGLPTAELFTNLDQLEVGDLFSIHILRKKLTYEVYEIETILPEEIESLAILAGEDLITLVTCTPYGINSHRLLVHAKRIEVEEVEEAGGTTQMRKKTIEEWLLQQKVFLASCMLVVVLILYMLITLFRNLAKRKKRI